jgi:hypothetical protein
MPKHDQSIAGLEALARLIEIAQRDTGRSQVLYVYRCTVCGHRAELGSGEPMESGSQLSPANAAKELHRSFPLSLCENLT